MERRLLCFCFGFGNVPLLYEERCDAAFFQLGLGKENVLLCGVRDNKNEDSLDEIFVYENIFIPQSLHFRVQKDFTIPVILTKLS
jgi:hypothetical protein